MLVDVPRTIDLVNRALALARVDWSPSRRQPRLEWVVLATAIAIAGTLIADAALVKGGTSLFPSTNGYPHFRFDDYAKLTVIGVVIGCAGWPIVNLISSAPRWLYIRLAVLISLVLFLPDIWLLLRHQPPRAVLVLMTMHVAVALVTYQASTRVAPARDPRKRSRGAFARLDEET
jgi:H+/Cl- antiporter ClcA